MSHFDGQHTQTYHIQCPSPRTLTTHFVPLQTHKRYTPELSFHPDIEINRSFDTIMLDCMLNCSTYVPLMYALKNMTQVMF